MEPAGSVANVCCSFLLICPRVQATTTGNAAKNKAEKHNSFKKWGGLINCAGMLPTKPHCHNTYVDYSEDPPARFEKVSQSPADTDFPTKNAVGPYFICTGLIPLLKMLPASRWQEEEEEEETSNVTRVPFSRQFIMANYLVTTVKFPPSSQCGSPPCATLRCLFDGVDYSQPRFKTSGEVDMS